MALFQQRLCAWPKGSWLLWLWHEWTRGAVVCIRETCTCLTVFVLRLASVCLTFTWIVNQVGFAFTRNSAVCYYKNGFCSLTPFLPIEMTSPVISVKNASAEYSGTYSCTVRNRVGSDQCLLRLDVVPRKHLLCALIRWFRDVYAVAFGSISKCVWWAVGCCLWAKHSGLVTRFSKTWKGKDYYILLIKASLL